ncbi:hypothetical protein [Bradyrhizobium sp. 191]|uniref:hypothetical protein n=1 Tax=Bradyrhizobium sp. 191 TaxID=2782659 RepID=UPI001FFFF063|nr:hypothetical protein [Bradyrhizobium sp. 191]UPJ63804.1 hypothetical protein IVB23_27985 [Bradyrhizobium sp. 191]
MAKQAMCAFRCKLKAAGRVTLPDQPATRTYRSEVNVETLISVAKFAQAFALKVFEIDPPAFLVRRVGREIMLAGGRSLADTGDVMANLNGQIVDVVRIPRVFLTYSAAVGKSR